MPDDVLDTLRREEGKLAAEIERLPQFKRLQLIRQFIRDYGSLSPSHGQPSPLFQSVDHTQPPVAQAKMDFSGKGTKSRLIVQGAAQYLREKARRATSGEIAKALQERGVQLGGKKPGSVVSAYLAESPLFDNVAGQGYGLIEWAKGAARILSDEPSRERDNPINELGGTH